MRNEAARLEQLVKEQKEKNAGNTNDEKPAEVNSEDETDEEVRLNDISTYFKLKLIGR